MSDEPPTGRVCTPFCPTCDMPYFEECPCCEDGPWCEAHGCPVCGSTPRHDLVIPDIVLGYGDGEDE